MAVRNAAVSDLVDGLHRVRRLTRQADVAPVTTQQVVAVMVDFEDRSHCHQAVLPAHLCAVGRKVRAAMGNAFGSPAWAGLDARLASGDLAVLDRYWWEVTRSYLEHVDTCLQDWRVAPARRRPTELVRFYDWRQGEDASYFRAPEPSAVRSSHLRPMVDRAHRCLRFERIGASANAAVAVQRCSAQGRLRFADITDRQRRTPWPQHQVGSPAPSQLR